MTLAMVPFMLAFLLLVAGLYAIVAKRNLIKVIVGILVLDYAANLLIVLTGFRMPPAQPGVAPGETVNWPISPIWSESVRQQLAELGLTFPEAAVDPIPQALILTSIVIGLSVTALVVALAVRLYEKYGTFDTGLMRNLKG